MIDIEHKLTGEPKSSARLESRGFSVDVPAESEAACDDDTIRDAAASQPCEGLIVIAGTYEREAPPVEQ